MHLGAGHRAIERAAAPFPGVWLQRLPMPVSPFLSGEAAAAKGVDKDRARLCCFRLTAAGRKLTITWGRTTDNNTFISFERNQWNNEDWEEAG